MEQEFINIINQVGFPIFVALYMMIKSSKDSKELRSAIDELRLAITKGAISNGNTNV